MNPERQAACERLPWRLEWKRPNAVKHGWFLRLDLTGGWYIWATNPNGVEPPLYDTAVIIAIYDPSGDKGADGHAYPEFETFYAACVFIEARLIEGCGPRDLVRIFREMEEKAEKQ